MSDARDKSQFPSERPDEQGPLYFEVNAPNYGAIGVFHAPVYIYSYQPLSNQQSDPNRDAMLEKVYRIWIAGLLEHSLAYEARIALHLETQPEAIDVPLYMQVQELNQPTLAFPPDKPIIDVFKSLGGALLILGTPGSGKTTLLLELARDLLIDARREPLHRIPVVFNLSSWAMSRPPLTDWFVSELNIKYDVPHLIARTWLDQDILIPLLDGLDEVAPGHRAACVDAINTYRQEHGLVPIAICSRTDDYSALPTKLRVHGAIVVQPLTDAQILEFVTQGRDHPQELHAALVRDQELRTLANTPLMLNILILVYQQRTPEAEARHLVLNERRATIFEAYISAMFQRRSREIRYSQQQLVHWLGWLAQHMVQHNQTVFYMEYIQPDWLTEPQQRRFDQYIGALRGILVGIAVGLLIGAFGLFIVSMLWPTLWTAIGARGILLTAVGGAFSCAVAFALLGLSVANRGSGERIHLVERLVWSTTAARNGIVLGLVVGGITGIVISLAFSIFLGLLIGLTIAIALGSLVLVRDAQWHDDEVRVVPNQGVWRSTRNGLLVSAGVGFSAGTAVGLVVALLLGNAIGRTYGVVIGTAISIFMWLFFGGETYMKHFLLRSMLARNGSIPWHLMRMLQVSVDRVLLRQVGGGFIFIHGLLMEYFASRERPI